MTILRFVTWAATEALRVVVMGSAYTGLIVIAMLAGPSLLATTKRRKRG